MGALLALRRDARRVHLEHNAYGTREINKALEDNPGFHLFADHKGHWVIIRDRPRRPARCRAALPQNHDRRHPHGDEDACC